MEPVYSPVTAAIITAFRVMGWRIAVRGVQHIPSFGPAVLATNHVGYLDFIIVGYAARKRRRLVRFLAKKEVFDHRLAGPLMRGMHHIPVDRFGRATDALDDSIAALRRGEVLGMFPESTISRSFVPAAGKTGAARMAMAAGAPLVPGAVWGTQRLLTKGRPRNVQRNVPITVEFGEAVPYEPDADPSEVTKTLMARIGDILERVWDEYPDRPSGPDDAWWQPAHLGGAAPTVAQAEEIAARERAERRTRRRDERRAERARSARGPSAGPRSPS